MSRASLADASPASRLARLLASPAGVTIILPLLVVASGLSVLLLGRHATTEASSSMARRQLTAQASDVQRDVAFALDQAEPLLASLRQLADPALPIADAAVRMRDLVVGRPGIANVSVAFPSGVMRGSYIDAATGEVMVQESIPGAEGTRRTNYRITDGAAQANGQEVTSYDPRVRPHYALALRTRARAWLPPRTFFTSRKTGLTVTEPVLGAGGALEAVTTVDFDVTELSAYVSRPPFEGARTVMFAADGTILAYPSAPLPALAAQENRLLRHDDYRDPALTALFEAVDGKASSGLQFISLATREGSFLAAVAPVGGRRAGIAAPLDWYLATLVPERVLLGPTRRLEEQSAIASAGALAIALGVALMFAWNLVRMRRAVGAARERARSAEARARELGSYRLVSRLGAGGMGEVWRAEHRLLARQAAIKLVRPDALQDPLLAPKIQARFHREAQTLASMRSQHTIALYDFGVTDDGTFYYVMELLDGFDLDRLVRDHGPQPAARVIHLMIQACQSLAEAHDAGLLHRDIKPANLFACRCADEVDLVKVLDFGIVHSVHDPLPDPAELVALASATAPATPSGRLTQVGAVVGTPGYLPPEQAFGARIDARADLYALACVAWWLLTATEVFPRGRDDVETIQAHVHEPIPDLRARVSGWLPDDLERVLGACLAKKPQARPDDARALIQLLRAIEIPPEHRWTEEAAHRWWQERRAVQTEATAPDARSAAGRQVLVTSVGREEDTRDLRPLPRHEAPTVDA